MYRFALALLTALVAVLPVQAAERHLLYPAATATALSATPEARPLLDALRRAATAQGTVKVIVGLKVPFAAEGELPDVARAVQRREISAAAARLLSGFSAAVSRHPGAVRTYTSLPFVALEVTPQELELLAADPLVISITENGTFEPSLAQSAPLVHAPGAWTLAYTGRGQTIAIIDTGVEATHPFLAGRIVEEACYSTDGLCPNGGTTETGPGSGAPCDLSGCWHGTHVAGIAAGKGTGMSGMAPDATLIVIDTASRLPDDPLIVMHYWSDIAAALERVYDLRQYYAIAAVNLSMGAGKRPDYCDTNYPAIVAAVRNLRSAGIATVAASGNNGYTGAVNAPACLRDVVSVGSVSDSDVGPCRTDGSATAADKVYCSSNSYPYLWLLAPGAVITSSVLGGGYGNASGTSMAAPHVAGAFAVLREKNPKASVDALLTMLRDTGRPISDYRANWITKPRIDIAAALARTARLRTLMAGTGSGSVQIMGGYETSNCLTSCDRTYPTGTRVKLTAIPALGAVWTGWTGACRGVASCSLRLNADTTVTATFTAVPVYTLSYAPAGTGAGTVSFTPAGGPSPCAGACSKSYNSNTLVKLKATPARGMRFAGWSGACTGTRTTCSLKLTADMAVTATFIKP